MSNRIEMPVSRIMDMEKEIATLKAELEKEKRESLLTMMGYDTDLKHKDEEISGLREALKAAQAVFNQLQCYSTGVSVMAEDEVVELFGKYSEAMDGLIE